MDTELRKWVLFSYVVAAALAAYIIHTLTKQIIDTYSLEVYVKDVDLYLTLLTAVIGGGIFGVLYRHQKINGFMNEVALELFRVTWPTSKETQKATIIVIIMVLISGVFLGSLDAFWAWALKLIL